MLSNYSPWSFGMYIISSFSERSRDILAPACYTDCRVHATLSSLVTSNALPTSNIYVSLALLLNGVTGCLYFVKPRSSIILHHQWTSNGTWWGVRFVQTRLQQLHGPRQAGDLMLGSSISRQRPRRCREGVVGSRCRLTFLELRIPGWMVDMLRYMIPPIKLLSKTMEFTSFSTTHTDICIKPSQHQTPNYM